MNSETARARELYAISPYTVDPHLLRCVARVKRAAARCNLTLGYLDEERGVAIRNAAGRLIEMGDRELASAFPIDAFQGGAGTSTNMAVNEWIGEHAGADPHGEVNLHQSTNDVMPTALRILMHDRLEDLELACEELQGELQRGEEKYDLYIKSGRTELRDAVTTSLGREYATWAHGISRDRWRCFKARERIREVPLGGTAIGTGAGAPRSYVLKVVRFLQEEVDHPISRAEHLVEATSNQDQLVEAMDAPKCLAVNLRRIASDIRLLASGPRRGFGELALPDLLPGSSIMAGKVNPVIPEAVIQAAERILANDGYLSRLAAMTELELNAFFPAIAHTIQESLHLAIGATRCLTAYTAKLKPTLLEKSATVEAEAVALLPVASYRECEQLSVAALEAGVSLSEYLVRAGALDEEIAGRLFDPANLLALGYDEALYRELREGWGEKLRAVIEGVGGRNLPEEASDER
ncbi:MAG: lyase family protein [Spirochaetaceae bacterium]